MTCVTLSLKNWIQVLERESKSIVRKAIANKTIKVLKTVKVSRIPSQHTSILTIPNISIIYLQPFEQKCGCAMEDNAHIETNALESDARLTTFCKSTISNPSMQEVPQH